MEPVASRRLDTLATPEVRAKIDRHVKRKTFSCNKCYAPVFGAITFEGEPVRLDAAPALRRGRFVLIPLRDGAIRALELTRLVSAADFGATAALDAFVLHEYSCGRPANQWWYNDSRQDYGRNPPALVEMTRWFRVSELQIGDRVLVALPPEAEPTPVFTPCHVTELAPGFVRFGRQPRQWDDRGRALVKRPLNGTAWEIFLHMCALAAIAQAGCKCEVPMVENRLGNYPMCRVCRTDAGFVKGLWRKRGWANTPTHISHPPRPD